ncbi:MAG TPA: aminotransferase class V-fold PLP-dependent enzyme [Exilispira sp.]|nr:aminotransferase class V-fold PLP-dependent enzyme [Exilispira sp.]
METRKNLKIFMRHFRSNNYDEKLKYYFNYANLCKVPKDVSRETHKFLSLYNHGSNTTKKVDQYFESARSHVASVFGGTAEKWFFSGPVSQAVTYTALHIIKDFMLKNNKKPEFVTYKNNFPSLILPIQNMSKLSLCVFNLVDYPENGIDQEWLELNVKGKDVFLLSLVDFFNGQIHDLDLIYEFCNKENIILMVDFSQFPFWGKLNVSKYKNTIFFTVLHKWLFGYPGSSLAYIPFDTLPVIQSWRNKKDLFNLDENSNIINTYEVSNRNPISVSSFEGSFKFVKGIGIDKLNKLLEDSMSYLLENISQIETSLYKKNNSGENNFHLFSYDSRYMNLKSNILLIKTDMVDELYKHLKQNGFAITSYKNIGIRLSTSFITAKEEVDSLTYSIKNFFQNSIYNK